jgi:hypothetical protein
LLFFTQSAAEMAEKFPVHFTAARTTEPETTDAAKAKVNLMLQLRR